jgi:hypothetical protein
MQRAIGKNATLVQPCIGEEKNCRAKQCHGASEGKKKMAGHATSQRKKTPCSKKKESLGVKHRITGKIFCAFSLYVFSCSHIRKLDL